MVSTCFFKIIVPTDYQMRENGGKSIHDTELNFDAKKQHFMQVFDSADVV